MSIRQAAQLSIGAAGFYAAGPLGFSPMTGFSIGFMIGGFLFSESMGGKNEIFDPGAQELPAFNQALRGVTMPILFGTNRVESNHVWRKNFETIRNESKEESGAGGKGGGSGGMGGKGGAPAGGGQVSYTYTLDVMYNLGMTDVPFYLYGGWVGYKRLNDQTIAAIGTGFGSNALVFGSDEDREKEASLEYIEAFYYPGGEAAAGWTNFLEEEDIDVTSTDTSSLGMRWKHTTWIGFKGLDLGGSPATPLLQFEVGPGGGELSLDDGFIGTFKHNNTLAARHAGVVSKNGKWITGQNAATGRIVWTDHDGAVGDIVNYSTDAGNFVTVAMENAGIDHGVGFGANELMGIIPGTNLVWVMGYGIGAVTRLDWGWIIIDLDLVPDNTNPWNQAYVVGTCFRRSNGLDKQLGAGKLIDRMGFKGDGDACVFIWHNSAGGPDNTQMCGPCSISEMKSNTDFGTSDTFGTIFISIDSIWDNDYPGLGSYGHTSHGGTGLFLVPAVTIGMFGPAFSTRLYSFVPREIARTSTNSTIAAHAASFPNGFIHFAETDALNSIPSLAGDTIANADFLDENQNTGVAPFDDDGKNQAGDSGDNQAEYRPEVHCHPYAGTEASGGHLCIFHKIYYGSTEGAPFGINASIRAFMYNPLSNEFVQVATGLGANPLFDTVADAGESEGNRFAWHIKRSMMTWSEDKNQLLHWAHFDDNGGVGQVLEKSWVLSKFGDLDIGGAQDVYPPYIIRQILTNPIYGMGYNDSDIDETSYALAIQYCVNEQIQVSTKYRREANFLKHIDELLSVYGGYIVRRGPTVVFGLMDFGSVSGAASVRILDNDHLMVDNSEDPPIQVVEGAQQDTFNRIKINYLDRALEYRQNFIEVNDEVDQDFRGVRVREFPPQFVMSELTATNMAIRALWSNLYARDLYSFQIGWKDSDLEPGDVVTLVDSFDPKLSGGVRARLTSIAERGPGKWAATATEELEHVMLATSPVNSMTNASTGGFNPGLTGAANLFEMYELPKEFQGADPQIFVGWAQSERSAGAKLWLSGDNVSFAQASEVTPYTVSGIFRDGLPARPHGYVEADVEVYMFPDVRSAAFDPSSPAYVEKWTFEDGGETQRSLGGTALWVGSEMVAYQGISIVGSNHYRFGKLYRGWGGTPIADQSSGAIFWRHGGGIFKQSYNEDKIGTKIFYKVTPFTFGGFVWPVESVDAKEYTVQGTYFRPQNPGTAHIVVDSTDFDQTTRKGLSDITSLHLKAEWPPSTRCEGYGALGYGFGDYGHFVTDVLSHDWRVEVVGSGGTVVHSTVVTTPFFVYSAGTNLADNGAFRSNVAFKITPFTTFGDSLRSEVVSLEFFGV